MQKSEPYTNKKNVFSNFVYQTNNRFRKSFKSGSFVDSPSKKPIQDTSTQTNFASSTTVNLSRYSKKNKDIFRESCTQTTKTKTRGCSVDRLTPDSLSPRLETGRRSDGDNLAALGPKDNSGIAYQRKNEVLRYLNQCEECQKVEMSQRHNNRQLLVGNALTKAYLEKNRNRVGRSVTDKFSEKTEIPEGKRVYELKSQSYVESSPRFKRTPRPIERFRVKQQEKFKPVNFFCQQALCTDSPTHMGDESVTRRSLSFMSPTISSEKKDKSIEINCIQRLIVPTKKGRSPSPKACIPPCDTKQVPYIDKSESTLLLDCKVGRDEDITKLSLKSSCNDMSSRGSSMSADSALALAISKLRDPDWNTSLRGLAEVVEICRILDSDVIYPHMTIINQRLIELIKSPRSHVSRTSCQAIGHLFEYVKDTRRPEFDELVDTLLCKCADANKFIRHDANLALDCMVTHIPTLHSVRAICSKGPDHKNSLVRIAASRLLVCALVIAGVQSILHPQNNEFTRKRIITNMTKFMNDRDAEVRKYGERVYKMLSKDHIFDLYLNRYIERDVINKMKKLIKIDNGRKF